MKGISRKIHFYQIIWEKYDGEKVQKDTKFIGNILSSMINQPIKQNDDELLYLQHYYNAASSTPTTQLYIISKIRKSDLPLGFDEINNNIFPLTHKLANNEGLLEPSHFVIFDGKIIGAEYNHYSVRFINTKLEWLINNYLKNNSQLGIKKVEIKPILRKEIYDLIDKFKEIRTIRISIATNYAKLLMKEDPQSFEKMFSAAYMVDDMWLHISFSLGRRKRYSDLSKFKQILNSIKKLLSREDIKNNVNVVELKGKLDGRDSIESINLLEELIMTEKRVPKLDDRTKAVNPDSMFREIINSYLALKDELEEFISPIKDE